MTNVISLIGKEKIGHEARQKSVERWSRPVSARLFDKAARSKRTDGAPGGRESRAAHCSIASDFAMVLCHTLKDCGGFRAPTVQSLNLNKEPVLMCLQFIGSVRFSSRFDTKQLPFIHPNEESYA
jgi:hypothetical protein